MKKFSAGLGTVTFLALIAIVIFQQLRAKQLLSDVAALREQLEQLSSLRDENQRLTEQLRTASQSSQPDMKELLRLRAQSATLRQLEQEIAGLKADREKTVRTNSQAGSVANNPFDLNHGVGASVKVSYAKHWGWALRDYAANHQGTYPATLAEAMTYLPDQLSAEEKAQTLEAAIRYEVVYRGSQDVLDALPPESTIIVREKEPWLDPQGRWCKAYCMSDGGATVRSSRKNDFEQWESLRIPKSKQQ